MIVFRKKSGVPEGRPGLNSQRNRPVKQDEVRFSEDSELANLRQHPIRSFFFAHRPRAVDNR